jgi:hypothetical protein
MELVLMLVLYKPALTSRLASDLMFFTVRGRAFLAVHIPHCLN